MFIKTKKQMKFKKNHAKIENTIKMEGNNLCYILES